jgi:adenine phosphoribosyltransferase
MVDLASLIVDVPDYPQPGIVFKDLTPLLSDAAGLKEAVDRIASGHVPGSVDKVVGIEARGFLLAAPVARTSSTTSTLSPGWKASWCTARVLLPYSRS